MPFLSIAQNSGIRGRVTELKSKAAVPFANVFIPGTKKGTVTDTAGNYVLNDLPPGLYTIACRSIGYKDREVFEVQVSVRKFSILNFELEENPTQIAEVEIRADPFVRPEESPLSLRSISSTEIYRSPGANRDISKVLQNLPGVGSSVSFRNDLIVRGGAPNENRFYLDGIEVPNINHFATQGSSGGPVGLLNVNFIREVDFYTGAFPANRGNALSSVMEVKQKNGNSERLSGTLLVGSSDAGITLDGPMGKQSDLIFSLRRSYLQALFKVLALPFLPTYTDAQFKQSIRFKSGHTLDLLGLGALDDFELNKEVNDGVRDEATLERNDYILGYLPVNTQKNYTLGAVYKIIAPESFSTFVVSRNALKNQSEKFAGNSEKSEDRLLDYTSTETENKLRFENTRYIGSWKIMVGAGLEQALYSTSTFRKINYQQTVLRENYDSELSLINYALFAQLGKKFYGEKLQVSLGIRSDGSDYSATTSNPARQLSPRLSASYALRPDLFLNFSSGLFYQLPAYTVLGYRDSLNILRNKENEVGYIQSGQVNMGLELRPTSSSKITVEGFYKSYSNYPFLLKDSISLANLGGDFGVIGNEEAVSTGEGRSYGIEFFAQQKLSSSVYGILSYTFFKSEFLDKDQQYRPSSWDNRHLLNLVFGKRFSKNWEAGLKFRLLGGAPYTPYDIGQSSQIVIWDITQRGLPDWKRLNEERLPLSHSLDIRLDKRWYFQKWQLNIYLDIQNLYNFQTRVQDYLVLQKDATGQALIDPVQPERYQTKLLENTSGNVLPSIGLMLEF